MADENTRLSAIELATDLTIAWLANPNTRASSDEVPTFLSKMYEAVQSLATECSTVEDNSIETPSHDPATTIRKSLSSKDHIISLIDGKPYKTLRRHLSTHGLTPAEYRSRYGLKADYPMVAPNYSEARRSMAQKIGLGRKPRSSEDGPAAATTGRSPRGRKAKQQAESE